MPRRARLDAPGTLHHVIIRGIEKLRIVDDRWDRRNFVSRLGQVAFDTETDVYAWALMTNHAHILLRSSHHGLSQFNNKRQGVKSLILTNRTSKISQLQHLSRLKI